MALVRLKVLLLLGVGLAVGLAGFLVYVCHQTPTKTTVRIIYAPSVPASFGGSSVSVTRRPIHGVPVVPHWGWIDTPFRWANLIKDTRASFPVATSFRDGVLIELEDHRWSWGGQRVAQATAHLPSVTPGQTFDATLNLNDADPLAPFGDAALCSTPPCSDGVARPYRLDCNDPDWKLHLSLSLDVLRGRKNVVTIDTSPLPILVPEKAEPYLREVTKLCYSAFGLDENHMAASELPPEGGNLSYSIEDEMTGTPYPRPEALKVTAKVILDQNRQRVPPACAEWTGKLAKKCWRAYEALPADACADAWPITLDTKRRVLHFSRPRRLGLGCHLLLAVEAPEGNAMHAIAFTLDAPAPWHQ